MYFKQWYYITGIYCRFTADVGQLKAKDTGDRHEASALRDEVSYWHLPLSWHLIHSLIVMQLSNILMLYRFYKLHNLQCSRG